jgi:hypothetical protein
MNITKTIVEHQSRTYQKVIEALLEWYGARNGVLSEAELPESWPTLD